jgi:hypothetical protein
MYIPWKALENGAALGMDDEGLLWRAVKALSANRNGRIPRYPSAFGNEDLRRRADMPASKENLSYRKQ